MTSDPTEGILAAIAPRRAHVPGLLNHYREPEFRVL
jgi:hypothetical protein